MRDEILNNARPGAIISIFWPYSPLENSGHKSKETERWLTF
jgi:hypothetical protein